MNPTINTSHGTDYPLTLALPLPEQVNSEEVRIRYPEFADATDSFLREVVLLNWAQVSVT
jgi:hypothetical protein